MENLATFAYNAYGKTTDYKNFQGLPMPLWDDLPYRIKDAWMAAVAAVTNQINENS